MVKTWSFKTYSYNVATMSWSINIYIDSTIYVQLKILACTSVFSLKKLMQMIRLLMFACCSIIIFLPLHETYQLGTDKRILVISDGRTYYGSMSPSGFMNLISQEIETNIQGVFDFLAVEQKLTSTQLLEKLEIFLYGEEDIQKPDVALVILGNDDAEVNTSIQLFRQNVEVIIARLQSEGIKDIFVTTPLLWGERVDGTNPYDDALEEFSAVNGMIAAAMGVQFIDIRSPILKYLERFNKENLPMGILTYDGFHLSEEGHILIAKTILEGLGVIKFSYLDTSILRNESDVTENPQVNPYSYDSWRAQLHAHIIAAEAAATAASNDEAEYGEFSVMNEL